MSHTLAIDELVNDKLYLIATSNWACADDDAKPFSVKLVQDIYDNELKKSHFNVNRVVLLEFTQYLEQFLWPNVEQGLDSIAHIVSIALIIVEKFREGVPPWQAFLDQPQNVGKYFHAVYMKLHEGSLSVKEETLLIQFLDRSFASLEVEVVRCQVLKLTALSIWCNLPEGTRDLIFNCEALNIFSKSTTTSRLRKLWKAFEKQEAKKSDDEKKDLVIQRNLLCVLLDRFLDVLENKININDSRTFPDIKSYCERMLELFIDLECVIPTRRYLHAVLLDRHLLLRCKRSSLARANPQGHLFSQLIKMFDFYTHFELDELTGEPLTTSQVIDRHYFAVTRLQTAAFRQFRDHPVMREFYMMNVASIDTEASLMKVMEKLDLGQLSSLAKEVKLMPKDKEVTEGADDDEAIEIEKAFLRDLLVSSCSRRDSQLEIMNAMPLYPTEDIIWDEEILPGDFYSGQQCLALDKLNLQFLTMQDYLLRNFNLFRLESTYEIKQDLEDALLRMKPWAHESGEGVIFGGWARMAMPIQNFHIVEVGRPKVGEKAPSFVRADIAVALNVRFEVRKEWEQLRKHDICFLVTLKPILTPGTKFDPRKPFQENMKVVSARGCEIEGLLNEEGGVIQEWEMDTTKPQLKGEIRTWRVMLDCQQYRIDMEKSIKAGSNSDDVYAGFNLIVRRKPKENNFKAVLETIRQLMNSTCSVPDWLHDVLLGYGDPSQAHYAELPNAIAESDFNDTFLNISHLKMSFPMAKVEEIAVADDVKLVPPYKLRFTKLEEIKNKTASSKESISRQPQNQDDQEPTTKEVIQVSAHRLPLRGPYPQNVIKRNAILFTPVQIEAIKSGMQPGLTMVVGPPGTGKTDVAVQIISNLYHNWPEQRTLIVTHSNQALNQLFEKIIALDVEERHLLRLGHGEEELDTDKDFSRYGRVNFVLAKRIELLSEVERLQNSLDISGAMAYTCETAQHFFLYQVQTRWENYQRAFVRNDAATNEELVQNFPFTKYFENTPKPIFSEDLGTVSRQELTDVVDGCWNHMKLLFDQLDEFRAFELLRSGRDRTEYLLLKEAKVIAMTCTHAALRRSDLVALGFTFDNILMEESAQILEIETFIPLLLQDPQFGHIRLKRWIMIGDHHQLPPVVKNTALQKFCNLQQSLFARLIRLGVPAIQLDAQGRARPSLANLYNWRYESLGDLSHVKKGDFVKANAGFEFDYQLIDVQKFQGQGEMTPTPFFYQNLAEAEFAVAIYMYMRLIGYPASKISILTTYNGQKSLIKDVLDRRCGDNHVFGLPYKVSTVDKYQGQQNDYIILSLVRTKRVGHIRDVRRLVVALSRARLGLYVVGRTALFKECFELTPAFSVLCQRPLKLHLIPNETYPTQRRQGGKLPMDPLEIHDMPHLCQFVHDLYELKLGEIKTKMQHEESARQAELAKLAPPVEKKIKIDPPKPEEPKEKEIEFEMFED